MKPDEINLLLLIQARPDLFARDAAGLLQIPGKRAEYLFLKWARKGWYDYGVSAGLGWLTEQGKAEANKNKNLK